MEAAMQLPATAEDGEWLQPVEPDNLPLAPDEVLLAVASCAVCRTDLQIVKGDLPARLRPVIPGHQAIGRVVEIGQGVTNWSVGQRGGTTWLAWACGRCRYCRAGRENLCNRARFTGWDVDGGFAPRIRVHKDFLIPLPDSIDDVDGAPLLCAGVIGYRALRLAGVEPGTRLGLFGFGASAHLALAVARHLGAVVHVGVRHATEADAALELGADSAGPYDLAPPKPLDAAITFAPAGSVVVDALRALGPGGRVIVNAIHLDGIPAFDYGLLWQERTLGSVANVTRRDAVELLGLAATIGLRPEIRAYPLRDANAALRDLDAGTIGAPSAVLVPS